MECLWVLLATCIIFTIGNVARANRHSVVFKSIRSTDAECRQYLPNDSTNCAVRCRGLVDRFWNDTNGIGYSIARFYQPSPDDVCYLNRMARCLAGSTATSDSCQRAEQAVKCYDDQFINSSWIPKLFDSFRSPDFNTYRLPGSVRPCWEFQKIP